jgi:hypothetical protein
MDILIDIILQVVSAFGKDKPSRASGLTPEQAALQQRIMQQRLAAMHRAGASKQGRVQPKRQVPPPVPGRPVVGAASMQKTVVRVAPKAAPERKPAIPAPVGSQFVAALILGEVLAPPVALRELEL